MSSAKQVHYERVSRGTGGHLKCPPEPVIKIEFALSGGHKIQNIKVTSASLPASFPSIQQSFRVTLDISDNKVKRAGVSKFVDSVYAARNGAPTDEDAFIEAELEKEDVQHVVSYKRPRSRSDAGSEDASRSKRVNLSIKPDPEEDKEESEEKSEEESESETI